MKQSFLLELQEKEENRKKKILLQKIWITALFIYLTYYYAFNIQISVFKILFSFQIWINFCKLHIVQTKSNRLDNCLRETNSVHKQNIQNPAQV